MQTVIYHSESFGGQVNLLVLFRFSLPKIRAYELLFV